MRVSKSELMRAWSLAEKLWGAGVQEDKWIVGVPSVKCWSFQWQLEANSQQLAVRKAVAQATCVRRRNTSPCQDSAPCSLSAVFAELETALLTHT